MRVIFAFFWFFAGFHLCASLNSFLNGHILVGLVLVPVATFSAIAAVLWRPNP